MLMLINICDKSAMGCLFHFFRNHVSMLKQIALLGQVKMFAVQKNALLSIDD